MESFKANSRQLFADKLLHHFDAADDRTERRCNSVGDRGEQSALADQLLHVCNHAPGFPGKAKDGFQQSTRFCPDRGKGVP